MALSVTNAREADLRVAVKEAESHGVRERLLDDAHRHAGRPIRLAQEGMDRDQIEALLVGGDGVVGIHGCRRGAAKSTSSAEAVPLVRPG